jgi:hypothetical protein
MSTVVLEFYSTRARILVEIESSFHVYEIILIEK